MHIEAGTWCNSSASHHVAQKGKSLTDVYVQTASEHHNKGNEGEEAVLGKKDMGHNRVQLCPYKSKCVGRDKDQLFRVDAISKLWRGCIESIRW